MRNELPRCGLPCLVLGFTWLRLRACARRAGQTFGVGRPRPLDAAAFVPPDSALARRVDSLAAEAYGPHLAGHGMRTWAIATAVARQTGLTPDPEALYAACVLHDLGLTEAHAGPEPFELRGARAAAAACEGPHADVVHEAIALHTSLRAAYGPPEVRLVQSGSGGDLVGLDAELVHPETQRSIARRWPKAPGFGRAVVSVLEEEVRPHPASPGAGLLRVGFGRQVLAYDRRVCD